MPKVPTKRVRARELMFISQARKDRIDLLNYGARLITDTRYSIDELRQRACSDRFRFANSFLECARAARRRRPPEFRLVVARGYYAMYHAFRAAVYFDHGGDDHQEHLTLPGHLPRDLPDRDLWENALKDARLTRNSADYEPYPINDVAFALKADQMLETCTDALDLVRAYLRGKGVTI